MVSFTLSSYYNMSEKIKALALSSNNSETSTNTPEDHTEDNLEEYDDQREICGTFCQFLVTMFRAKSRLPVTPEKPDYYVFTYPAHYHCCNYVPTRVLLPVLDIVPESEMVVPAKWFDDDDDSELPDTDTSAASVSGDETTMAPEESVTLTDGGAPEVVSLPVYPVHDHKSVFKEMTSKLLDVGGVARIAGPYEMTKRDVNLGLSDIKKESGINPKKR